MPPSHISLPASWRLEDVQAALNVIIAVESTLGIFVFIRTCWLSGARKAAHNKDVPLPSLLSLNTLGEALDVAFLLREQLFSVRNLFILVQCIVVLCLSSTAILSGVISRYSTSRGHIIIQQEVPGLLASRQHNGMGYANVEWNLTYSRLDRAGFPEDQLLDFLPSNEVEWVYRENEFNNSWSFNCRQTPQTFIDLYVTDNCTGFVYEIPNINQVISFDEWTAGEESGWWRSFGGFYSSPTTEKDILLFIYAYRNGDYTERGDTYRSMNFSLASVHMHNLGRNQNDTEGCFFSEGPVESSSYTRIDCSLEQRDQVEDPWTVAFPEVYTPESVPAAYRQYYQARFTQESTSDSPISVITPEELIRFYQTYTIVKDLQYRQPVTRTISVNQQVVLLSTAFLAIAVLVALLIILGILNYGIFAVYYRTSMATTPQSKLDWMLQSIEAEHRPLRDIKGRIRKSVTVESSVELWTMPTGRRRRTEFENAEYRETGTTTHFLKDSTVPPQYSSPVPGQNMAAFIADTGRHEYEPPQGPHTRILSTPLPDHEIYVMKH